MTPGVMAKINTAIELITQSNMEYEQIDITDNSVLQKQTYQEIKTKDFPLFYENHIKPIGTLEQLKVFLQNKSQNNTESEEIKENAPKSASSVNIVQSNDGEISTGVIGSTLETIEWVFHETTNWISPLSWFSKPTENVKPPSCIEIPVIQSNWYGRQQNRTLRFGPECMERIHPITKEVRKSWSYEHLNTVTITDKNSINFTFVEALLARAVEYYQVSESNMRAIVNFLKEKLPYLDIKDPSNVL